MALPPAARAVALRVEAPAWRRALPGAAKLTRRAALAALRGAALKAAPPRVGRTELPLPAAGGVCLVLADDALQRRLNRDFRGRDKPTNVLSFDGAPAALGDVVLALETIAAEAEAQGKPLADHVVHLVVHGVLHLLGYDHETQGQARSMERLEIEILAGLGIGDPYHLPRAPVKSERKRSPRRNTDPTRKSQRA
ncbi:MAG TPA: rRNA maturation RNase YbeY [Verrucomicrobiae bacterium]|jgi:probable rRNA maturation factor|nr:rRNA maturation RNase YbeY [Verrucomicrobiae bacterium]